MAKKINKAFNSKLLASHIWAKRKAESLSTEAAAKAAGLPNKVLLYRLESQEAESAPKVDTLVTVCNWLEKPLQTYF